MPTIGGSVVHNARRLPDRAAIIAGGCRWTWREVDAMVSKAAGTLAAVGLAKGDRFAIVAGNCPEFLIASFVASRLGAIVVPVNSRLAAPGIAPPD
jgi:fatty-acyl-CoA synthase/feruloyl-CoA synthase